MQNISRNKARKIRHRKIRKKIFGTLKRPRLCVFKSNKHIFAQIINDEKSHTLAAASSLKMEKGSNIEAASKVGSELAKKAKAAKIKNVVFDRGGNLFHGRIKALAEASKKEGLKF